MRAQLDIWRPLQRQLDEYDAQLLSQAAMLDALSAEIHILKQVADTARWEAQRCEALLREAEMRLLYAQGHNRTSFWPHH